MTFARAAILLPAKPAGYAAALASSLGVTSLGGRGIDLGVTGGKLQQTALKVERPGDAQWIALTDGAAELLHVFRAWLEPVAVRKGDTIGLGYLA